MRRIILYLNCRLFRFSRKSFLFICIPQFICIYSKWFQPNGTVEKLHFKNAVAGLQKAKTNNSGDSNDNNG